MSWTLSTSGAAIAKAGLNYNQGVSGAMLDKFSDEAEGSLCSITRINWITQSGAVIANFKPILDDTISDMVAMKIINYDMSGYSSRLEATTMLDVLRDNLTRNLEVLKDQANQEKMF